MLEKTAASLEPCGFQRVLPGATKSFRSSRQLHTAFWQHGAADIELTNAWQALMHGTFALDTDPTSDQSRTSTLNASTFLLDFLYPSGAVALMRRLVTTTSERNQRKSLRYGQPFTKVAPRLYTSSVPRQQSQEPKSDPNLVRQQSDNGKRNDEFTVGTGAHEADRVTNATTAETDRHSSTSIDEEGSPFDGDHVDILNSLLTNENSEDADHVWYHYKAIDEQSQNIYLSQVLVFLSKSGRLSDSWKISELFHKLDLSRWGSYTFVAGVAAEINLQNDKEALELFVVGLDHSSLDHSSLVDAFDLLLSSALRSSTIDSVMSIWQHYPKMAAKWDFEGITSQLKHVALVSGLAEKAFGFQEYSAERLEQLGDPEAREADREALDTLQKILVRRALVSCPESEVIPLLDITKDPLAFEEFIRAGFMRSLSQTKSRLVTEVYKVYRELPGSLPSHSVLHEIFRAYQSMNAPMSTKLAGIEVMWGDWHRFHTTPSRRAFQRYLAFYASKGDKERVYSLWPEFIELYRDDPDYSVLRGDDTFTHLLQVHAVQGEAEETQRIFDDISGKFGIKPSTHCWNILLNAYVKAGDYDGAISTFDRLAEVSKPDKYSYATLMQMAGGKGDLGFTVDLYRRARSYGVLANDAILSALVDAYCQNEHFQEAEDVCVRAAVKGIVATQMWNKLLYYHAMRRDLVSINRILNLMAEKNIPYNQYTYQKLLLGLSLCRQSQHALHLLSVALKDNVFQVMPEHFYIVMGALLKTGEPGPVRRLHKLMKEHGFPSSSGILFRLSQALTHYIGMPAKERRRLTARQWLGEALRSFYQIYGFGDQKTQSFDSPRTAQHTQPSELLRSGADQYQFSTMVYILTQLKDFVRSRELIDFYRFVFPGQRDNEGVLPARMLNSIMLADLQDKRYDRVKATWRLLFDTAKQEGRSLDFNEDLPHTPKISARYRYILSGGLRVMQELLFIEEDVAGILAIVSDVRAEGFEIDSKNWNYYVQVLIQLKQYKEAFITCEKFLMPNWTGWFVARTKENIRNKLPLDVRRKGGAPRYLRPVATTLYRLAQGYMELDRLAPWSAEAGQMIREIDEECVAGVRAIKSMIRVHSDFEYEIFGPSESIEDMEADEGFEGYGEERGGGYDREAGEEEEPLR